MDHYATIAKPRLPYRYEFHPYQTDPIRACIETHGFAVVKQLISPRLVDDLKHDVWQAVENSSDLPVGQSGYHLSFVETSPACCELLKSTPFMTVQKAVFGSDQLLVNRSAAIIRTPSAPTHSWHTDWHGFSNDKPKNCDDLLNRGNWPSGSWFYLTGSSPAHGGLAVIADSHVENWHGPAGFELMEDRRSFYPRDREPAPYDGFDVPGMVPLFTDPGDQILFAARTYHAAFPNQSQRTRLSCAIVFRPRCYPMNAPWPLSESAQDFCKSLPPQLEPYFSGYTGIDPHWAG